MVLADRERFALLMRTCAWTFAKTMPENPHHYTRLRTWDDPASFLWCAHMIWAHGVEEMFWGKPYTLLHVGGFKYWSMDPTPEATDLINRKSVLDVATDYAEGD